MKRFARTELLIGSSAMEKFRNASVLVAGLGAVGSYAVEGLARSGIGSIAVVDFDVVRESNINRQLYAVTSTIGMKKTVVAEQRILDINPACRVESKDVFIDEHTAGEILKKKFDVVIDAIDSLGPKVAFLTTAVKLGQVIISSMGAATRTDPSLIRVDDISRTDVCPLARKIRKALKKNGVSTGIKCVFSLEQEKNPPSGYAGMEDEVEFLERGRERRTLGSLSVLTGIFGLTAAREAIFYILEEPFKKRGL